MVKLLARVFYWVGRIMGFMGQPSAMVVKPDSTASTEPNMVWLGAKIGIKRFVTLLDCAAARDMVADAARTSAVVRCISKRNWVVQ